MVNSKIVYPYGVAVDYPNRHIFWVDTYLDYIERADYDGRDRRTILRGSPIQNLYSVTVFQGRSFVRVGFAFGPLGEFRPLLAKFYFSLGILLMFTSVRFLTSPNWKMNIKRMQNPQFI